LKGARRIEKREWGKNNVVRLIAHENETQKSGVASLISTAILLKRKNDDDRFVAHVEVNEKAGKRYAAAKALRKIRGKTPGDDPIVFDPKSPASLTLKDKSKTELESVDLESLAGIVSTTIISTVKDKNKRG
jgi:hypothetical protein